MKSFTLVVLAPTVLAFSLSDIIDKLPKCSLECVTNGTQQVGCGLLDIQCQCNKFEQLTKIVAPCLVDEGCRLEQITQTAAVVVKLCEAEYNKTHNASDENQDQGQKTADSKSSNSPRAYTFGSVALVTVLSFLMAL